MSQMSFYLIIYVFCFVMTSEPHIAAMSLPFYYNVFMFSVVQTFLRQQKGRKSFYIVSAFH